MKMERQVAGSAFARFAAARCRRSVYCFGVVCRGTRWTFWAHSVADAALCDAGHRRRSTSRTERCGTACGCAVEPAIITSCATSDVPAVVTRLQTRCKALLYIAARIMLNIVEWKPSSDLPRVHKTERDVCRPTGHATRRERDAYRSNGRRIHTKTHRRLDTRDQGSPAPGGLYVTEDRDLQSALATLLRLPPPRQQRHSAQKPRTHPSTRPHPPALLSTYAIPCSSPHCALHLITAAACPAGWRPPGPAQAAPHTASKSPRHSRATP